MSDKSTPEEIRARFDADVERFSNLETGQTAMMHSQLVLDLVTRAGTAATPHARRLLDVVWRPGGSLWIADLVSHDVAAVQALLWARYGDYLTAQQDAAYRERVFAYVAREDTPRSLMFQLDLLRASGFAQVEVLHKNGPYAAF